MDINVNENAALALKLLKSKGYKAYIAGGCVRDCLLNIIPKDWDITTDAKPDSIIECFKDFKHFEVGKKYGTISVIINGENFEITTFRSDGEYSDTRHPDSVSFSDSVYEDLARRDFTVNAMAYDENEGIIDPFGGQTDLKYKTLRCVGDCDKRFKEDALRILRCLRFSSVYGFSIEMNTSNAIFRNKNLISKVSSPRIISELNKLLCGENCDFVLRRYREVLSVIIPEIRVMFDFDQNNFHHDKTLWKHTVTAVRLVDGDELLKTVMLLHDIGKPMSKTTDEKNVSHYKGHPKSSALIANRILKRLGYPNDFINRAVILIENHDCRFTPNKRVVRRALSRIGEENMRLLLKVQRADILSQSMYMREEKLSRLDEVCEVFEEVIADKDCFSLKDLKINGNDLIGIGITNGVEIGNTLKKLLEAVIDESVPNDKNSLILKAKQINEINTIFQ